MGSIVKGASPRSSRRALSQRTTRDVRTIARWLDEQPWNAPGSDKTWMLLALDQHRRYRRTVRAAGARAR
jgi:hypothetical protein